MFIPDDIGSIVVGPDGPYNTPEGIMAGYNAAKIVNELNFLEGR